jgi:hypothetical protein
MTERKSDNLLRGDRTPAYVDRETGAAELRISTDTWDQWVKAGRLPPPCDTFPSGTPRWRWEAVDRKLSGRTASDTRWKEWVTAQVKKYDWDIEPDDADHPTIHGLRGTGILARAEQGYEVDQIANDIGMSRQNVEHYMRFKDQMQVAAQGQKRLRLV